MGRLYGEAMVLVVRTHGVVTKLGSTEVVA